MDESLTKRPFPEGEDTSESPSKKKPPPKRTEEGIRSKKESDYQRAKSRIYIGVAFERWRTLKEERGLRADTDVALFLLDCYDTYYDKSPAGSRSSSAPASPLSSTHVESESTEENPDTRDNEISASVNSVNDLGNDTTSPQEQRFSGLANLGPADDKESNSDNADDDVAPQFYIGADGTLQGQIDMKDLDAVSKATVQDTPRGGEGVDEGDMSMFPQHRQVQSEQDIVGQSASIIYEANLMQLTNCLQLPVNRCTWSDSDLGIRCDGRPPFNVRAKSRGTATLVEWFCPHGHSLWKWNSQPTFKYGMQAGDFMLATNILLSGNNYSKMAILFKFMNMGIVAHNTFFAIQNEYCVDTIKDFCIQEEVDTSKPPPKDHAVAYGDGRIDTPGEFARTLLALLDHHFHDSRPPMITKKGQKIYRKQWNQSAQRWRTHTVKADKEYGYIPGLQRAIVGARLRSGGGLSNYRKKYKAVDPSLVGLLVPESDEEQDGSPQSSHDGQITE